MPDQHDSSSTPAKGPALTNGISSSLLAIFSGSGIGLLVGLLVGLSASPTVGLVIGGLASSLALILGLNDRYFTQAKAIRIGTFGFVCVAGALLGTYIRTHALLEPSLENEFARYTDKALGFKADEAREILKFTRELVPSLGGAGDSGQRKRAGVLFSAEVELDSCRTLENLDELPPSEIVNTFVLENGTWREMAELADSNFDPAATKTFLLAARIGLCDQSAKEVGASSCKKLKSLPRDVEHKVINDAFASSEGIWKPLAQSINKSDMNSKDQATALWIAKTALCKRDESDET